MCVYIYNIYVYGSYMGEAVEPYAPKQPFIRCFVCSLVSLVHTPSMGTAWQLFTWGSNTTTLAKAKGSGQVSGGMSTRLTNMSTSLTNSSLMIFGVTDKCQLKNVILAQLGFRFFQVCLSRSDYNKHSLLLPMFLDQGHQLFNPTGIFAATAHPRRDPFPLAEMGLCWCH